MTSDGPPYHLINILIKVDPQQDELKKASLKSQDIKEVLVSQEISCDNRNLIVRRKKKCHLHGVKSPADFLDTFQSLQSSLPNLCDSLL